MMTLKVKVNLLQCQLHEPWIFYPSGHWPETVTNAHVSAHFRKSLGVSVISTHIRTEGLYVKTTIIYQLKRLCVLDCAYTESMFINCIHISLSGLGSIPFFQFNSNSVIFNSNSNSTTHKKFQFQFQFQRFQFQFQFQFRRFQILAISILEMTFDVFFEIDYNYTNKLHVYKIIVINTISLISLVKWLWLHGIMMVDAISIT